ncbi:GntR family transcriptional regulator [Caballeronia choica]|jgi:DNA-binding transcriptional regulator YhcF (GntR family)|uniref:GntR family transcriptional regulator n=1 Tax=Caballeronia choica TaxID=326476 RepID=UPI000B3ECA49|nr:GntR family transcriptional regulator [Caballeronia choica]
MCKSIFQLAQYSSPAFLALAHVIEMAIREGAYGAGDRLPSQRMLADLLGLHVNTVCRALRETRRRGLTSGNRRKERGYLELPRRADSPNTVPGPKAALRPFRGFSA